jgi:phosphatidylserine decarboxylase
MRAEASAQNEQNIFTMTTEHGEIVVRQIAGFVARRVVSWKKIGDTLTRGERIGLVRFGSRADVWLPATARINVKIGDNVAGGSSILAFLPVQSVGLSSGTPNTSHADENLTPAGLRKP